MTNAHYFGDDIADFGADTGEVSNLARRQFLFSLTIGVLLLASAALISARPLGVDSQPVAQHQIKLVAPLAPVSTDEIALPGPLSSARG